MQDGDMDDDDHDDDDDDDDDALNTSENIGYRC